MFTQNKPKKSRQRQSGYTAAVHKKGILELKKTKHKNVPCVCYCSPTIFASNVFLEFSFEIVDQTLIFMKISETEMVPIVNLSHQGHNNVKKITNVTFFLFVCLYACFKSVCLTPLSHCDHATQTMD